VRIFTIPPDVAFLPALVSAILAGGFPSAMTPAPGPADLPRWTILVPTRRASRELRQSFLAKGGARLLPRIRPIGDVDEDLIAPPNGLLSPEDAQLPEAISSIGREFLLLTLIEAWAGDNPQERLAAEIRQSPVRALGLARGLAELVDSFETEEASLDALAELFGGDFALHRLAILDFLAIVRQRLPAELHRLDRLGPMERRGRLIRLEATRLKTAVLEGPIIAAGSTGSIPATAELLKVIGEHEQGAVVLPGLDCKMDEASWNAVTPQHPQFGLKRILDSWQLARSDVALLPGLWRRPDGAARAWLVSETMRPSDTAGRWRSVVRERREDITLAARNLELIEARNRREEALAIALILREALEQPAKTAALVTPDRELAQRVKSELKRWNIAIEDSAGEGLIRFPQGSLLGLLIENQLSGFEAEGLAALIHHPLLLVGLSAAEASRAAGLFDLAVLRYGGRSANPGQFGKTLREVRAIALADRHPPDAIRRVSEKKWALAAEFAARLDEALQPLLVLARADEHRAIADQLQVLLDCAEAICKSSGPDDPFWSGAAGEALAGLIQALAESATYFPASSFARAGPLILDYLNVTPVRTASMRHERLAILGLLEARLVRNDIVVMGGLNEGKWPAQPDSGPWLNRPMRETLGLAMPERHIGLTAHDFAQALGAETVYLTWSKRVGDAPAVPSRWILRLQMLFKAAALSAKPSRFLGWARGIDGAPEMRPIAMPKPRPPVTARPKSLSFTEVETLIRDPYAIYARKVLRLEPLPGIAEPADASLRGQLIHEALNRFTSSYPDRLPDDPAGELIRIGRAVFAPHVNEADVAGFWWPRFLRIAPWFVAQDHDLRQGTIRALSEVPATWGFLIGGEPFKLTGRADRIDLLDDGSARIIDFKTGDPPSSKQVEIGLSPQLTLEAAVLELGGFSGIPSTETQHLLYIKLSGGEPPGRLGPLDNFMVMKTAREHLAKLQTLLAAYGEETAAYIPRHIPKTENERSAFDHLSRWGEWARKEATE